MADEPDLADQLAAPLGQTPTPRRRRRLPRFIPQALAVLLAAAVTGFVAWTIIVNDPLGGEPVAIVSTKPPPKPEQHAQAAVPPGSPAQPAASQSPAPGAGQNGTPGTPPPADGQPTVTIIDGSSGRRQVVTVAPAAGTSTAPAPAISEKLLEKSRHGMLPRIAADGTRPSEAYASRVVTPVTGARIAIVIGRMGLSASTSAEALAKLPPAVAVAFPPYGADLERWATRARGEGREVLLQVPLEPFDYPDNDAGPQTLLTTLAPEQNTDRLYWAMSRFPGYLGIGNYMGARFAANEPAVSALMREAGKRGLLFFDDGSVTRGLFGQSAAANNVPYIKADVVIDAGGAAGEIDLAFARLEALARERGSAVGSLSALPLSVERLAKWAKTLESRGIVLVPLSTLVGRPKSS